MAKPGTRACAAAGLLLAGCGGAPPANPAQEIEYASVGTAAELDCGAGKTLSVTGSNNTLRVTGECASVSVSGSDNTIALARVDGELTVSGVNNAVNYAAGDPAVRDEGSGNRISTP